MRRLPSSSFEETLPTERVRLESEILSHDPEEWESPRISRIQRIFHAPSDTSCAETIKEFLCQKRSWQYYAWTAITLTVFFVILIAWTTTWAKTEIRSDPQQTKNSQVPGGAGRSGPTKNSDATKPLLNENSPLLNRSRHDITSHESGSATESYLPASIIHTCESLVVRSDASELPQKDCLKYPQAIKYLSLESKVSPENDDTIDTFLQKLSNLVTLRLDLTSICPTIALPILLPSLTDLIVTNGKSCIDLNSIFKINAPKLYQLELDRVKIDPELYEHILAFVGRHCNGTHTKLSKIVISNSELCYGCHIGYPECPTAAHNSRMFNKWIAY